MFIVSTRPTQEGASSYTTMTNIIKGYKNGIDKMNNQSKKHIVISLAKYH